MDIKHALSESRNEAITDLNIYQAELNEAINKKYMVGIQHYSKQILNITYKLELIEKLLNDWS